MGALPSSRSLAAGPLAGRVRLRPPARGGGRRGSGSGRRSRRRRRRLPWRHGRPGCPTGPSSSALRDASWGEFWKFEVLYRLRNHGTSDGRALTTPRPAERRMALATSQVRAGAVRAVHTASNYFLDVQCNFASPYSKSKKVTIIS
jgi:hypothetical protein